MQLAVLALDDVFDTGLTSILDCFDFANALVRQIDPALPTLTVHKVGLGRSVVTHQGMRMTLPKLADVPKPDILLVPAMLVRTAEEIHDVLQKRPAQAAAQIMADAMAAGTTVGTACSGSFIAAASGILDGRRATTAWWLAPAFRQTFPAVQLEETQMVVDTGPVITAGGGAGHLNLALWLLRKRSPLWANTVARYLMVDTLPTQAPYIIPDHLMHGDPLVERFEVWIRTHITEPFCMGTAARELGVSERSLQRRVQTVLGKSPVALVQDLRVEQAIHLLNSEDDGIDSIAERVGYANGTTLRNLIRRKLGRGVRELRARSA